MGKSGCRSSKCKYYENYKEFGGLADPCNICSRFYPDQFRLKKEAGR